MRDKRHIMAFNKKQTMIPKIITEVQFKYKYSCPICNEILPFDHSIRIRYCTNCGQRINPNNIVKPKKIINKQMLGNYVRNQREKMQKTQQDFANIIGKSKKWISQLENGAVTDLDIDIISKIAFATWDSVDELFYKAGYTIEIKGSLEFL